MLFYLHVGGLIDHLPLLHPCQGPLFDLPKLIPQCIRFDSMHVLCLGVDLLVAGNVMKTLLQYDFWGDGDESQKLLVGWQRFKQWARTNGWQPLASQIWWFILFIYGCWSKFLSRNGHSSRIKILLSRNFRELHVYLSRGPCWPTTPLMKIRSPPAKLRQRITDHFLVAF